MYHRLSRSRVKQWFVEQAASYTHTLTAAVVICTRLAQDQASQHYSMEVIVVY